MGKTSRIALAILLVVAVVAVLGGAASAAPPGGASASSNLTEFKNIIVFISDGTGAEQLELGRQLNGGSLFLDSIPWAGQGTLDTSSLDGVTDSAAAATALATGFETHNGWLSMIPGTPDPVSVETALERAESNHKSSGLITDVEIDDATPAAWASHVTDRGLGEIISTQMAQHGIETLFGGGDGSDTAPLLALPGVTYVQTLSDLQPYFNGTPWPSPLYGIIGPRALVYNLDREEEGVVGKQPTLPQFTDAALHVLQSDGDGFLLMVEGGAIDWGGHARDPGWIGAEVREFDQAVKVGYQWAAGRTDTLLLVVSDHETGGLDVSAKTNYAAIRKQTATTEWMWGLIKAKKMTIKQTLATYAGITDLTSAEQSTITKYGEMGISDVLAARDKVTWGWKGKDEGDHTLTPVPVRAWGPGASVFNVTQIDNEFVGQQLLLAAGN